MSTGPGRSVSLLVAGGGADVGARGGASAGAPAAIADARDAPYRGELGATRRRAVRVRSGGALVSMEVYVAINADTDPELGARARGDLEGALHAFTVANQGGADEVVELAVPLIYHEPSRELLALVLPSALRHRELEERLELYHQLQLEAAATPIPAYVLRFEVVIGAAELRALRASRARAVDEPAPAGLADSSGDAFALRVTELTSWQRALEARAAELEQRTGALARREAALQLRKRKVDARARAASAAELDERPGTAVPEPSRPSRPSGPAAVAGLEPPPDTIDEELSARLSRTASQRPVEADPVTTEWREQAVSEPDSWLVATMASGRTDLTIEQGRVRIALAATLSGPLAEPSLLRGPLDVRVVLHRTATFPVVALLLGAPAALRGDRRDQVAALCLDVSAERDRAALAILARRFELTVDVLVGTRWARRVRLAAPLTDNVAYLLQAAADHRQRLAELGVELSPRLACAQVAAPEYDVTGAHHRKADQFRDRQLLEHGSAEQLRASLTMAATFTKPDGEDYLVCVRGFPLARWRTLRRQVLAQAVTWGIWMGPDLAHVAVSEGLARSRRDLVHRLVDGFELLRRHPTAFDLDDDTVAANLAALKAEARARGVVAGKQRTLIDSEMDSVVAGTIDLMEEPPVPVPERSDDELISDLHDPAARLPAALELCRRNAGAAAAELAVAIAKMSRAEAVQAFAATVPLGLAMETPFISLLSSSKAYLRQGAAMVLALLRSDDGVTAIVNLLLTEPTELWPELARALGQVGPQGLHHLTKAVREHGVTARVEERVAWALAHLGARDCHPALSQMSGGHSIMGPIAAKALALVEPAMRGALPATDSTDAATMNRSFSWQFFAAVDPGAVVTLAADSGSRAISIEDDPSYPDDLVRGVPGDRADEDEDGEDLTETRPKEDLVEEVELNEIDLVVS